MLYLGGYTPGIRVARLADGVPVIEAVVDGPADPTYLALAPGGRHLYALHELDEGLLTAYAVTPDGGLRPLGVRPSGGGGPCHLSVHPAGGHVLTAHYGSGHFAVHPLDADGTLRPPSDVVDTGTGGAHMIVTDPSGRWVLTAHLGLGTAQTWRFDAAAGRLHPHDTLHLGTAAGPRHLAFHPDGARLYVVNELDSTLVAARLDAATGRLTVDATVGTLPAGTTSPNHPSGVRVSPDGRFVVVANRAHDSIAVFATGPHLRLLATHPCGGEFPRDLVFSADGTVLYVANQHSDEVTGFAVDPADGAPRPLGWTVPLTGASCVLPTV